MADAYLAGLLNKYEVGQTRVQAVASQIIYPRIAHCRCLPRGGDLFRFDRQRHGE